MAQFKYEALDATGRPKRGTIDSDSHDNAIRELRQKGLFPTSVREFRSGEPADKTPQVGGPFNAAKAAKESKKLLERLLGGSGKKESKGGGGSNSAPSTSGGSSSSKPKDTVTKTVKVKKQDGFAYVAYDMQGNEQRGVIHTASSAKEAEEKLRKAGLFPAKINENIVKVKEQQEVAKKPTGRAGAFFKSLRESTTGGFRKMGGDLAAAIPGGQAVVRATKAAMEQGRKNKEEREKQQEEQKQEQQTPKSGTQEKDDGSLISDTLDKSLSDSLGEGPESSVNVMMGILECNQSGFAMVHQEIVNVNEKLSALIQAQLDAALINKEMMNELRRGSKGKGKGSGGGGQDDEGFGDEDGFGMDDLLDAALTASMLRGGGRGKGKGRGGTRGTKRGTRGRRRAVKNRARRMRGGRFGRIANLFRTGTAALGATRAGSKIANVGSKMGTVGSRVAQGGRAAGRGLRAAGSAIGGAARAAGLATAAAVPGAAAVGAGGAATARTAAKVGSKALKALGPVGLVAAAGTGAYFEGADAYDRAKARGASEGEAKAEAALGGTLGAIDAFNPVKLVTMFAPEDSMLGRAHEAMSVENQIEGVKAMGDSATWRQVGSTLTFGLIDTSADKIEKQAAEMRGKYTDKMKMFKELIAAAGGGELGQARAGLAYYKAILADAEKAQQAGEEQYALQWFNSGANTTMATAKAIDRIKGAISGQEATVAFLENEKKEKLAKDAASDTVIPPRNQAGTANVSGGRETMPGTTGTPTTTGTGTSLPPGTINTTATPTTEMRVADANIQNRQMQNQVASQEAAQVNNATITNINAPNSSTSIAGDAGGGGTKGDSRMNETSYREDAKNQQRANMF